MKPTIIRPSYQKPAPSSNPLILFGRYLDRLYFKYLVNTALITFNPSERLIINSVVVVSVFLFLRYTYFFGCQLWTYLA